MDGAVAARALHVLVVVLWIGGVSLVTTVVVPAVRRHELGADAFAAFQAIERRFVWQARAAIVIVGATGFSMVAQDDLWYRFREAEFWWMHAMVGLWLLFAIGLFVAEPFFFAGICTGWPHSARPLLCLAARDPLGSAHPQPRNDLRRGRGQPRVAGVLTVSGNTRP